MRSGNAFVAVYHPEYPRLTATLRQQAATVAESPGRTAVVEPAGAINRVVAARDCDQRETDWQVRHAERGYQAACRWVVANVALAEHHYSNQGRSR